MKAIVWRAVALFVLGGFVAACSDNPVDSDHELDHVDAYGLLLVVEDDTLYSYDAVDGTVNCSTQPCQVAVGANEVGTSIEVHILDREGRLISADELEDHFELRVHVADETIVLANLERSGSFHRLLLTAQEAGSTRMRIALLHGGEHEDFSTPPLEDDRSIRVSVGG